MRRDWEQNREQRLRERGLEPGTFAADQLERKLLRGEMMGFAASPNTFAAVTVLLVVVTAGLVVQRLVHRDGLGWLAPPLLGIVLGAAIIVWADSKTAYLTPLIAAGILAMLAVARGWLARHFRARLRRRRGRLPRRRRRVRRARAVPRLATRSTASRSAGTTGSARRSVFAAHPMLGVGWDNFGLHYLAARLPVAAEEVRDPHNFIVRFATELGAIGAILLAAWMLRLWWELTRPRPAPAATLPPNRRRRRPRRFVRLAPSRSSRRS